MYVLCVLDRQLFMNNVLPTNARQSDRETDDNHIPAAYEEQSMLVAEGLDARGGDGDGEAMI